MFLDSKQRQLNVALQKLVLVGIQVDIFILYYGLFLHKVKQAVYVEHRRIRTCTSL